MKTKSGNNRAVALQLGNKGIRDLALAINVPYYRVYHWILVGKVPGPSHKVLGSRRRYYLPQEFDSLVQLCKGSLTCPSGRDPYGQEAKL